jgi:hypothetical protein
MPQCHDQRFMNSLALGVYASVREHDRDCNI